MIVPMLRFYLFLVGEVERTLEQLQKKGLVEVEKLPREFGFLPDRSAKSGTETILQQVDFVKKVLGPRATGKVLVRHHQEEEKLVQETPLETIFSLASQIQKKIEVLTRREKRLKQMVEELETIEKLDIPPAELKTLKNFAGRFFFSPTEKASWLVENYDCPVQLLQTKATRSLLLIIFPVREMEERVKKLLALGLSEVSVTPYHRKPSLILEKVHCLLERTRKEKEDISGQLEKLSLWREKILVLSDWYNSRKVLGENLQLISSSMFVKGFCGWVPQPKLKEFQEVLEKYCPDYCLITKPACPRENPPVALVNHPLVEPFEVVTDTYGKPLYGTIDPTGPLSLFFALSFAFCLTDAAYGVIVIAVSLFLLRYFCFQVQPRKFFLLMVISGFFTVLVGTLTGGWFGDLLTLVPAHWKITSFLRKLAVVNPLGSSRETFLFLGIGLVVGYLQIIWGLSLNIWKWRRYPQNLIEPWILLLIQILVPVIAFTIFRGDSSSWMIIILVSFLFFCFLSLSLLKARQEENFLLKLFWAFYTPYNVAAGNLLADPLSYCRLFGLGLSTSVLALAVNKIVFLAWNLPYLGFLIAIFVFLLGHLSVLAINLLGAYVHSSRLQYLEFFSKFFEAGGRPFRPFTEIRKHTILQKGG